MVRSVSSAGCVDGVGREGEEDGVPHGSADEGVISYGELGIGFVFFARSVILVSCAEEAGYQSFLECRGVQERCEAWQVEMREAQPWAHPLCDIFIYLIIPSFIGGVCILFHLRSDISRRAPLWQLRTYL